MRIFTSLQLFWRTSLIKSFWDFNWNWILLRWSTKALVILAKYYHHGQLHLQWYFWVALLQDALLSKKELFPKFKLKEDYINSVPFIFELVLKQQTLTGFWIAWQSKEDKRAHALGVGPLVLSCWSFLSFLFFSSPGPFPFPRFFLFPAVWFFLLSFVLFFCLFFLASCCWTFGICGFSTLTLASLKFPSHISSGYTSLPWLLLLARLLLKVHGRLLTHLPVSINYKACLGKASVLDMIAQEIYKLLCILPLVESAKKWINIWIFSRQNMLNTKLILSIKGRWYAFGNAPPLPYILQRAIPRMTLNKIWTRFITNGLECKTYQDGGWKRFGILKTDGFWWQRKRSSTCWSMMLLLQLINVIWLKRLLALKAAWRTRGKIWEQIWLDKHCSTSCTFLMMPFMDVKGLAPHVANKIYHMWMQLQLILQQLDTFIPILMRLPCLQRFKAWRVYYHSHYQHEVQIKKKEKNFLAVLRFIPADPQEVVY